MARIGIGVACLALAMACEPWGPIPGGRLEGTLVSEPVSDWSFTDAHSTVELETRPESPYSVTVWCVSRDGVLYVPSRHAEKKSWVQHVLADPRVRVKVGERIYPATIARVEDPAEIEAVVPALVAKYDLDPPEEGEEQEVWLFRLRSSVP
jgi:hypothetical protein